MHTGSYHISHNALNMMHKINEREDMRDDAHIFIFFLRVKFYYKKYF